MVSASLVLSALVVNATMADPVASTPRQAAAPTPHTVTLITGDTVEFAAAAGTPPRQFTVEPAEDRHSLVFHSEWTPGPDGRPGYYVIPADAAPAIAAGALDRELFNLTGLVAQGLDDRQASDLPVIVRFDGRAPRVGDRNSRAREAKRLKSRADDLPGSKAGFGLAHARAAALTVERGDERGELWKSLATEAHDGFGDSPVDRIWLDRSVSAADEASNGQIGAPDAWKAGYDGTGVTVAVLDTGIDDRHPDLSGKVDDERNFTEDPDARDGYGHGTHVASTVAGTGDASGGGHKGVAPGATLFNGKVLDSSGSGTWSQVMAGMEWAATDKDADVVNLSLGGGPTDGTDPVSELVDTLTERTGALFVVAAGNHGDSIAVDAPGAADRALTVGAVDRADDLADFSSRGPRLGDGAVKPNLTAPGVGIIGARAEGTSMGDPVDADYTAASGTSMATPHVAAAAAIMTQARPDLDATAIKDLLASTASDTKAAWFAQGAGRLDLTRAVSQHLTGPASVDFGKLTGDGVSRQLTFTNTGKRDSTLRLKLSVDAWDGEPVDPRLVSLSQDELTVPAKSTATVSLSVKPGSGRTGVYGGTVVATTGDTAVRVPFGLYSAPESTTTSVRMLDRDGEPVRRWSGYVLNTDKASGNDPFSTQMRFIATADGKVTVEGPPGVYDFTGYHRKSDMVDDTTTIATEVERRVDGDSHVTLDGREAVLAKAITAKPTRTLIRNVSHTRMADNGVGFAVVLIYRADNDVYVTPTARADNGTLEFDDFWSLGDPLLSMRAKGSTNATLHPATVSEPQPQALTGRTRARLAYVGGGSQAEFDAANVDDAFALMRVSIPDDTPPAERWSAAYRAVRAAAPRAAEAEATALVPYLDIADAVAIPYLPSGDIATVSIPRGEGERLRAAVRTGEVTITARGKPHPDFVYHRLFYQEHSIPSDLRYRIQPARMAKIPTTFHADRDGLTYGRFIMASGPAGSSATVVSQRFPAPATWNEYYGPRADAVNWWRHLQLRNPRPDQSAVSALYSWDLDLDSAAVRRHRWENWARAPMRYGATTTAPFSPIDDYRYGFTRSANGQFAPGLMQMDSDGHFVTPNLDRSSMAQSKTVMRMYHDGREIPANYAVSFYYPTFAMGARTGTFRLETDVPPPTVPFSTERPGAIFTTAPHIMTTWTFRSAPPREPIGRTGRCVSGPDTEFCRFQPIIQLNHELDALADDNRASGGRFTFTVRAGSHRDADGAAEMAGLKLSYSTDGGETWDKARVRHTGGGSFRVQVSHPHDGGSSGSVRLRTSAWDTDGNRVDQTIERAYLLN